MSTHRQASRPPQDLTDLIEDGLNSSFWKLRLPGDLETKFNRENFMPRFSHVMQSGWFALIIFNLFLIVDWLLVPDIFWEAVFVRVVVFSPLCLMILLLGQFYIKPIINIEKTNPNITDWITMLSGWGAAISLMMIISLSNTKTAVLYAAGFSVIILYGNLVQKLAFGFAVAFTVGTLLISQIAVVVSNRFLGNENVIISIFLFLLVTGITTLISSYVTLKNKKRNFLLKLREKKLIEDLNAANARLEKVSRTDTLTGLFNRRHFTEHLDLVWQRAKMAGQAVTLLMIDVDHFKAFNDNYGHQAGDECLKHVADAIRQYLRDPGDLTARYGGEEFVAVLHPVSRHEASEIADRLRLCIANLRMQHEHSPTAPFVTVSIGVGVCSHDGQGTIADDLEVDAGANALIAIADKALYAAKHHGRNRVHMLTCDETNEQTT